MLHPPLPTLTPEPDAGDRTQASVGRNGSCCGGSCCSRTCTYEPGLSTDCSNDDDDSGRGAGRRGVGDTHGGGDDDQDSGGDDDQDIGGGRGRRGCTTTSYCCARSTKLSHVTWGWCWTFNVDFYRIEAPNQTCKDLDKPYPGRPAPPPVNPGHGAHTHLLRHCVALFPAQTPASCNAAATTTTAAWRPFPRGTPPTPPPTATTTATMAASTLTTPCWTTDAMPEDVGHQQTRVPAMPAGYSAASLLRSFAVALSCSFVPRQSIESRQRRSPK